MVVQFQLLEELQLLEKVEILISARDTVNHPPPVLLPSVPRMQDQTVLAAGSSLVLVRRLVATVDRFR